MDQLRKMFKRISKRERSAVREVLIKLESGNVSGLDMAPLRGRKGAYRIRVGSFRIIAVKSGKIYRARYLFRRNEGTYKDL